MVISVRGKGHQEHESCLARLFVRLEGTVGTEDTEPRCRAFDVALYLSCSQSPFEVGVIIIFLMRRLSEILSPRSCC